MTLIQNKINLQISVSGVAICFKKNIYLFIKDYDILNNPFWFIIKKWGWLVCNECKIRKNALPFFYAWDGEGLLLPLLDNEGDPLEIGLGFPRMGVGGTIGLNANFVL